MPAFEGSDGLEGVIAAHTILSDVDGAAGRLVIRGRSLDQLSGQATYEEVVHLLSAGFSTTCRRGGPDHRPRPRPRRGVRRGGRA